MDEACIIFFLQSIIKEYGDDDANGMCVCVMVVVVVGGSQGNHKGRKKDRLDGVSK